jgi:hypothetical protein
MIKLIINYAKDNNFKKIILDDDSKFHCLDIKNDYYYELRHLHTLTSGLPWQGINKNLVFIYPSFHKKYKS